MAAVNVGGNISSYYDVGMVMPLASGANKASQHHSAQLLEQIPRQ